MILLLSMTATIMGCATTGVRQDYARLRHTGPKSVLVVPAINRSIEVNAPDYFLSTIVRPVAERGYYVFPVNIVKRLLEDDGPSDANVVHEADPRKLAEIFGADAMLYVTIERWDAKYLVLSTHVTVALTYVLKSSPQLYVSYQAGECSRSIATASRLAGRTL
jgi:hypothetical protein